MRILTDYPYVPSEVLDIIVHHAGEGRTQQLIRELDSAGFQIVPKPDPRERVTRTYADGRVEVRTIGGEPVTVRVVTGDEVDPAPRLGTVALLTPEGERLIQAVAQGDFTTLTEREFAAVADLQSRIPVTDLDKLVVGFTERPVTPEDFTGQIKLERGEGVGATQVYVDSTPGMSPWILKEVVPGDVKIEPDVDPGSRFEHEISASATAVLAKGSDRREITTRTSWNCMEVALESAVHNALSSAIRQAREAAAAFISATSPAPVTAPEEAA